MKRKINKLPKNDENLKSCYREGGYVYFLVLYMTGYKRLGGCEWDTFPMLCYQRMYTYCKNV